MADIGPSVGQPMDRVDGRLKVTGGARYSADMPVSGLAYGALIMSRIPNGQITKMDIGDAQALPGVIQVITPFNALRLPQNAGSAGGATVRSFGRIIPILQDTNVYYSNQPIGVAVAETLEQAVHAAGLVHVTYAQSAAALDLDKNRKKAYAPRFVIGEPADSSRGNTEQAYASAAVRVGQTYTTPYETHNPMEPHATIAVWDGDNLTLYDTTQGISGVQQTIARMFGMPSDNVRVVSHFLGGGFGCKGSVWSQVVIATLAAKQTGRPVKLVLSRAQMFGSVGFRPRTEQKIELGAATDGTLGAVRHDLLSETSTYDEFVEPSAVATRMLYASPNCATSHRLVRLNTGTPTYMRAPGESSGTYALESAMDELALALNQDPIDLRLANYAETDPGSGLPWTSKALRECYSQGADRFQWSRRTPAPRSMRTADGRLLGLGMGTATYPARRGGASAMARILPDGTGYAAAGTQDLGTGTYTIMTQIAADALGIGADRVRFELGDTRLPPTPGSGGSTTAATTGSAVYQAGVAVRAKAIAAAIADAGSPLHGLSADAIDVAGGRMFVTSSPDIGESYSALMSRQALPNIEATVTTRPDASLRQYSAHSFGAVFAEVAVDPDLGEIRVQRVVGAYDIGRPLNLKTANSQLMGGIVWGISMALLEQTVYDPNSARIINADLAEYHVPVNADVPPIEVIFVQDIDPHIDPLGARGIGEIGITGVVAAIANAVAHATGTRVRDLPITLDKVLS